jgi:hypothetical protein
MWARLVGCSPVRPPPEDVLYSFSGAVASLSMTVAGKMFWFIRNRFAGSNFAFSVRAGTAGDECRPPVDRGVKHGACSVVLLVALDDQLTPKAGFQLLDGRSNHRTPSFLLRSLQKGRLMRCVYHYGSCVPICKSAWRCTIRQPSASRRNTIVARSF